MGKETWIRYSNGREVKYGSEDHELYGAQNGVSMQSFTKDVVITPATTKKVEVSPAKDAWTETTGHTCSCGATK